MPPIKGRMMSRMGGMVQGGGMRDVKNVRKKAPTPKKRMKIKLPDHITEDEQLMRLRMPSDIVRILPSVKKYKGGKDFVDLTDNMSNSGDSSDLIIDEDRTSVTSAGDSKPIIGIKRGRGSQNKYVMKLLAEERFCSMIWAVAISPHTGLVYVSCHDGVFICDTDLDKRSKLDKIVLPGGVGFLPDGQVVVLCRNSDTVNFFSKDGIFIRQFAAGSSPMDLVVHGKDTVVVSDPGDKCVHVYDLKGVEVHRIPTMAKGYRFQWPLYLTAVDEQCFIVCDCHSQKVNKFAWGGKYMSTYRLQTVGNNEVLRPHGVCMFRDDLFVVDTSMDSIEAFCRNDVFIQTIIPREDGLTLKPKCMDIDSSSGVFVIGGRTGVVRVYQFLDTEYYDFNTGENVEFKIKEGGTPGTPVKHEVIECDTPVKAEVIECEGTPDKKEGISDGEESDSEQSSSIGSLMGEEEEQEEENDKDSNNPEEVILLD